jgi:hypothetical protein
MKMNDISHQHHEYEGIYFCIHAINEQGHQLSTTYKFESRLHQLMTIDDTTNKKCGLLESLKL